MARKTIDLTATASQSVFAELVGVTQQAISLKVSDGLLPRDGTYGEWLALYCDRLRKEASGRTGEAQDRLINARIEESQENTAEKKQRRLIAARDLLQRADVEVLVIGLATTIRQSVMGASDELQLKLESKYSIELKDDDIKEPLRATLRHVADRADELVGALQQSS